MQMLGERLGQGNTAEVYEWLDAPEEEAGEANTPGESAERPRKIVKLFFPGLGELPEEEGAAAGQLAQLGLPVPRFYGRAVIEGRAGLIYARVEGGTLTRTLSARPGQAEWAGEQLAELHRLVHRQPGAGLISYKKRLARQIRHTGLLPDELRCSVLERLGRLPDGGSLCHGDFHPENVLLSPEGPVIIDWSTAACGHPSADAARTRLLLTYSVLPSSLPPALYTALTQLRHELCEAYTAAYLGAADLRLEELEAWEIPLAAARLSEQVPEAEQQLLLERIRQEMG